MADARHSSATAILGPETAQDAGEATKVMIQVANPRLAFAQLLDSVCARAVRAAGRPCRPLSSALISAPARTSRSARNVSSARTSDSGENVTIHPLSYIGDDVEIADNTVIEPNVTLLRGTIIGKNCIVHSGTVLGADGFGYLPFNGTSPQSAANRACRDRRRGRNRVQCDD